MAQQQFESLQRKLHGSTKTNSSIGFDPFAGPYEHPINRLSPSYSSPNPSPNNYYFDKHHPLHRPCHPDLPWIFPYQWF